MAAKKKKTTKKKRREAPVTVELEVKKGSRSLAKIKRNVPTSQGAWAAWLKACKDAAKTSKEAVAAERKLKRLR